MRTATTNEVLVRAESISVRFGTALVLDGVDFELSPGQQVALTGRSGSGKTTLLMALAGICPPQGGTITWPSLHEPPPGPEVGVVFQAPSLLPELSALENVQLPLRLRGLSRNESAGRAAEALHAVGLADAVNALPTQMSGGQCQRAAIARVLAGRHRLVIADEPTGALDRSNAQRILSVLRHAVEATGGALIVATHDENLAATLPLRLRLDDGRLCDPSPAIP